MILARLRYRDYIREQARKNNKRYKELNDRIERDEMVQSLAQDLYDRFKDAGATWAAAVQAIKTDWVSQFTVKWSDIAMKSRK